MKQFPASAAWDDTRTKMSFVSRQRRIVLPVVDVAQQTRMHVEVSVMVALTDCLAAVQQRELKPVHYPNRGFLVDVEGYIVDPRGYGASNPPIFLVHKERWFRSLPQARTMATGFCWALDGYTTVEQWQTLAREQDLAEQQGRRST